MNNINTNKFQQKTQIVILVFSIVSVLFVVLAFLFSFKIFNFPFNFTSFINIHLKNPVLFLLEFFPILMLAIYHFYRQLQLDEKEQLDSQINNLEDIISKNIAIAEKIGKGNLELDEENIEASDKLGTSLFQMNQNIKQSYAKESELNWITRGKELLSSILNMHTTIDALAFYSLVELISYTEMIQGAFYVYDEDEDKLINIATYAYNRKKYIKQSFSIGQGLIGQASFEQEYIYRKEIPEDYLTISSGILGDQKPKSLLIVPLIGDEKVQGVLELASLNDEISQITIDFYKEIDQIIGQTLFNLKANSRTERLLSEARNMTQVLRKNEEELKQNATQMEKTQEELEQTNKDLESQIEKVENAQKRLNALLENASEVISIYDEYGIVRYESPSVKSILGYNPEDVIGKNAFQTKTILNTEQSKEIFYDLLEKPDEVKVFEYQFFMSGKDELWLESTARNLLSNPAINGILFNTRDITVRKIAERAQRFSGQMAALSENSPDMIMRVSPQGMFYYVNPVVRMYTGIAKENFVDRNLSEIGLVKEVTTFFESVIEQIDKTREKFNKEVTFPAKFGERIVLFNVIPEFIETNLESILIVGNDITERKQIELEIEQKNRNITESINYAYRIQSAILPSNYLIKEYLPKSFLFYRPRDVVSGDFPWFFVKGDYIYIAAVDCTGHGVPGALLSLIGYFLLNNIVDHDEDLNAGQILDLLHAGVRRTLKQDTDKAQGRDGMDIALCKINTKKMQVQFAGAHRPLYIYADKELKIYKGNSKAIGGIPDSRRKELDFVNHIVNLKAGHRAFFFSDGLPDQIGGPKGRKYQAIRIRESIKSEDKLGMEEMASFFAKDFEDWKKDNKQIDDVLLIGIEF
ncbi:MAG: PAS domain S-box protein [Bacteroidales bacterium]|nr:PAS domain S-box protein [Bacteroidales bacterium]